MIRSGNASEIRPLPADLNVLYVEDPHSDAFWTAILEFVRTIVPDEDNASVVTIKLLEALPAYKHTGKIEHWIRRIARNATIDEQRRYKEDVMCNEDIERLQADIPATLPIRLDLSVIVDTLDRMLAECIVHDGNSAAEAARRCGMSERGARKRLARLGGQLKSPSALIF